MHAPQVGSRPLTALLFIPEAFQPAKGSHLPWVRCQYQASQALALPVHSPGGSPPVWSPFPFAFWGAWVPIHYLSSLPTHFPVSCSENRSTHRYFLCVCQGRWNPYPGLTLWPWLMPCTLRQRDEYLKYMHTYLEVDGEFFLDWKVDSCVDTNLFQNYC